MYAIRSYYAKTNKAIISKKLPKLPIAIIILLLIYIFIIPAVTSWPLLRNQAYRNLIGTIETGENFSQQLTPISIEKIRVVDRPLAYLLGDKVLGAQPALGSQVVLGDFSIQRVKDGLYWVAPLVHSGFFKWQKNSAGTNGYVMVNATNERDVKLVQEVQGKPIRIKYQPDAFFQDNLERHVYFNGYMTAGLTDYTRITSYNVCYTKLLRVPTTQQITATLNHTMMLLLSKMFIN